MENEKRDTIIKDIQTQESHIVKNPVIIHEDSSPPPLENLQPVTDKPINEPHIPSINDNNMKKDGEISNLGVWIIIAGIIIFFAFIGFSENKCENQCLEVHGENLAKLNIFGDGETLPNLSCICGKPKAGALQIVKLFRS